MGYDRVEQVQEGISGDGLEGGFISSYTGAQPKNWISQRCSGLW